MNGKSVKLHITKRYDPMFETFGEIIFSCMMISVRDYPANQRKISHPAYYDY